jgi:ubiquinone/menaquinone biosynthesis C-methylase UbiE
MPGLEKVTAAVCERSAPVADKDVVDLGSGSGQVTLKLAPEARSVLAVDFSSDMLRILAERATEQGLDNVSTQLSTLQALRLPDNSVDLVVSNYALHHLRHPEKVELLDRCAKWLRPGGRIVVGDMMFGLTGDSQGRQIIAGKVRAIAKRGPAGWWRIAKNAWKMIVARQECPEPMGSWESMLAQAGFTIVESGRVVAEAAFVAGCLPES